MLYDYATKVKKLSAEEAADSIRELMKLWKCKRQLGLISEKKYTDEAIKAIELLCEYLSHKDKKWIYAFAGHSRDELYKFYCNIFRDKKAAPQEVYFSMQKYYKSIEELSNTGLFDVTKNSEYNYIYFFNKDGEIGSREIPAMLDILFDCKLRSDVELIINL